MTRIYTASVVGAGAGGKLSMAGLATSPRFELVAAADVRADARQAAAEKFPGLRTFATHDEMFRSCPTDIVCVSTWPPSHLEITQAALELPLTGILVEKPLGDTTIAGRRIVELIKNRNLPVVVPHGLLVADHAAEIIRRVRSGEIGDLKLVQIECTNWDIINAGIHWLNFFVTLTELEPVDYVLAACDAGTRTYRDGMQVETVAVTLAETRSGIRVVMQTGDYVNISRKGKSLVFRLVGTGGTLEFWAWESAYRILNADHPTGELIQVTPGPVRGHQRHLENLAAQMDSGAPDYTVIDSSLMALELCEAAYVSSRHQCVVRLPLETFAPPPAPDPPTSQPFIP